MTTVEIASMLAAAGWDPKLAMQAAASLPLYVGTFTVVKRWQVIPERFEMLLAALLTALANVTLALGGGTSQLFPALSAAAVGAWLAMIGHALIFKKDDPEVTAKWRRAKRKRAKPSVSSESSESRESNEATRASAQPSAVARAKPDE